MKSTVLKPNRRILVIDDNPSIHTDFRDILCPTDSSSEAARKLEAALFDEDQPVADLMSFDLDSAFQGQEGLAMVEQSLAENRPYGRGWSP